MYLGLDIGSLPPLFEGELLDTNSGDPVNIALPKLQRETDSASTPASKLLSDYTIAEVENNSNRIDENVLKMDFYNTLDKKCQGVYHQNFEELSKQSLKNALEFQSKVYRDFTKEKVKLSEKQLVSTDRYGYPCIVTNCSFTDAYRGGLKRHLFKHTKVSPHYCEQCFPNIFFARDKTELNRHIGYHHSTDSTLSKYGAKRVCPPDQSTMNFFSECNVSQASDQQQTDSASTPVSNLLFDYTIAQLENNSNHIDESVLKADFYNKYQDHGNRIFYSSTPSNSEVSVNSQILKYGAKRICPPDQSTMNFFSECNVSQVSDQQQTDSASTPVSNLLFDYTITQLENNSNHIDESVLKADFYNKYQNHGNRIFSFSTPSNSEGSANSQILKYGAKRICPPDQNTMNFFSECNVSQVSDQQKIDSASTPASKLLSDCTIAEVKNNSTRIDESVLKTDFYNTLDKVCQEVYHQNFEELSKQSLKNALEFQGRVYEGFTKEKVKLSEKQLVSTDRYEYPCIVTNCLFTRTSKAGLQVHLFKHIKVSHYYCEQCLPYTFFVRDKATLNKHIRIKHSTGSTLSEYGAKRICPPDQSTMNFFSECNVSQVSDQQQTDSASTPVSKLLFDYTIAQLENNTNHIYESVLKADFYNKYQNHGNRIFSFPTPSNSEGSANSQILKYGAKRICPPDQNTMNSFSECNVSVTAQNLVGNFTETPQQPSKINTDFPENAFLPPNFEQLHVSQVSDQQQTDSASAPASKLLSDYTTAEVENNSNRIDESVLKTDFYNTLDKVCQEVHHQNFEELSKQSLKDALEFQGRVYQDFTKEKAKLSEQQLVSSDKCEYPCIVTDCSFTHKHRVTIKRHLFKHIKVSPYYCEQCLPHTFFLRDMAALNEHKINVHVLDKVISKRGINQIHQPVQNTINGSSGFTVNQESDPCSLLNSAKRAKTDP